MDSGKSGSVFSEPEISQAVQDGRIICVPFSKPQVGSASLDISLGQNFYRTAKTNFSTIYNPFDRESVELFFDGPFQATPHRQWVNLNGLKPLPGIPENHPVIALAAGERILAHSHEFIGLDHRTSGWLSTRSMWAKNGISLCLDSNFIEPGTFGRLTLEIVNHNAATMLLPIGEKIAQIVFIESTPNQPTKVTIPEVEAAMKAWSPSQMLPRSWSEERALPTFQAGEKRPNKGLFICLEGGDGSGKGTQYKLLINRLKSESIPLLEVDFPRYGEESARPIEWLLNSEFGDPTKIDARLASLPFSIDRKVATAEIIDALMEGKVVIANRFSASNLAHHGAKFSDRSKRVEFFNWLHDFEHVIMQIPEPDFHYVLHVPAEIARQRILAKANRSYTNKKLDGLEADLDYQRQVEETYLDLVKTFPNKFGLIECVAGKYEKSPEEIQAEIWRKVKQLINHD